MKKDEIRIEKKIFEKIKEIKKNNIISEKDKILIAFSGGPDSVFLYYFLNFIKKSFSLEISIIYVNHNLRYDIENDLEFIKEFAEKNNVDYYVESVNVEKYSSENKKSIELAARELRYEAIEKVRKKINYDKIATGHNLNDNVETFIFRLLRGTSLNGLKGIPKVRENIIRPILDFEKSEILNFLKSKNQKYIVDYTNNENDYTRNFIRNKIFPDFDKINPDFRKKIFDLIQEINERELEKSKIEKEKIGNENFEISRIRKKDEFVHFLKKNEVEISREKINRIFENFFDENGNLKNDGSKEFYLGKNKILKKKYDKLEIIDNINNENIDKNKRNNESINKTQILKENQSIKWYNFLITLYENIENFKKNFKSVENIDYTFLKLVKNFENNEKIQFFQRNGEIIFENEKIKDIKIIVRSRKDGDIIFIKNLGHKKVKKILIDEKVEKWERDLIPIVEMKIFEKQESIKNNSQNEEKKKKRKEILTVSDIKFSKFLEKINKNDVKNLKNNERLLVIGRKNGR